MVNRNKALSIFKRTKIFHIRSGSDLEFTVLEKNVLSYSELISKIRILGNM